MATEDKTADATGYSTAGRRINQVLEYVRDFAKEGAAAADIIKAIPVKAGMFVERVVLEVETAEGAAATIDVGDGDDPDGFLDGADVNTLGMSMTELALTEGTPNTVTGYTNGKLYSADDTIDLTLVDTLDAAKLTLRAYMVDLRGA